MLFDLNKKEEEIKTNLPFISQYILTHFERVTNVERDLKRLPEKEEFFGLFSEGQFNAFTFIPFVIKEKTIKQFYLATYSINRKVITALM
jgi:hypothetical protein